MESKVTAVMLYDLVACPHRVTMDQYGDTRERDTPNPFAKVPVQDTWFSHPDIARQEIDLS